MIKTFNSLFVTMLGLGKIKFIPGTLGSLVTTIILYCLFHTLNLLPITILIVFINMIILNKIEKLQIITSTFKKINNHFDKVILIK